MAAAGLVYIMGGTSEQMCQAASCAVQNILGTICDPVAGLVQIPCINRNAMSAANAVVSANMILGGFNPLIPLDQTAETLFRVGRQLPSELRCTCHGGLCTTPCGQQLAAEQEEMCIRDRYCTEHPIFLLPPVLDSGNKKSAQASKSAFAPFNENL